MFLGWALAGILAGPDELAARQKADAWTQRYTEQYLKAFTSGNPRDFDSLKAMTSKFVDEKSPDAEAFLTWYSFQGNVSFVTMLLALALQEWLLAGRTIGKRIFNLRTISLPDAEAPGFLPSLLRSPGRPRSSRCPTPFHAARYRQLPCATLPSRQARVARPLDPHAGRRQQATLSLPCASPCSFWSRQCRSAPRTSRFRR